MHRRYSYSVLRSTSVALLALVPVATSACGFAFTHGPPPGHQQMGHFTCTEGNAGPILDGVTASLQGVAVGSQLSSDNTAAAVSLGWVVLYGISAYTGLKEARECRDARRLLADRLARAQVPPLEPVERVRISHDCTGTRRGVFCDQDKGVVTALTSDSVVLQLLEPAERLALPLDSVMRLEVYAGRKAATGWGALAGALTGFVPGLVIGLDRQAECESQGKWMCEMEGAGWATVGLMGGALVGALVGAFIKTDRWEEVPLDQLRVQPIAAPDGRFGIAASVRF